MELININPGTDQLPVLLTHRDTNVVASALGVLCFHNPELQDTVEAWIDTWEDTSFAIVSEDETTPDIDEPADRSAGLFP